MVNRGRVDEAKVVELMESDPNPELVAELTSFGVLMLNDARDRTQALDSKATSCLGWSAALLGLQLYSEFWTEPGLWHTVVAIHSVVLAAIASIAAFEALRGRSWDGPSQEDWFCEEEQSQPDRVRAFHVVSLLKQHSNHDDHNERKSLAMMTAQTALVMAAVLTAATILLGRLGF